MERGASGFIGFDIESSAPGFTALGIHITGLRSLGATPAHSSPS
ncbi:hypothetical protein DKAM_0874 [Desulfurococcus amylolyticus 1221n]|uniref:Uncharacterized protein n=1 Tax=Desulfurococcus amylolyticus (strain DSM 18924 / JCM 16383 / VKM B-2413 / 1221n) TaxID=490899 RepID=B8D519_DESA1|nr:hypothetical protein DKAM_0874 [Desulfurococcus amylolyticus 1221n]